MSPADSSSAPVAATSVDCRRYDADGDRNGNGDRDGDVPGDVPAPPIERAPSWRPSQMSPRRFWVTLAAFVSAGLLLRVLYVLVVTRHENGKLYDAAYYELQGWEMVHGMFFSVLFSSGPDAAHPPLTAMATVPATWLFGLDPGATPQRLTMALLGSATVLVVGVLGRRLAGPVVGLVAAAVAASYPNMWIPNGIVMSETLVMLAMALVLVAVYRVLRTPTWSGAALTGVACGAVILVRAELALLVPAVVLPAVLSRRQLPWRRRWGLAGVALVSAGLVLGPWVGRNLVSFRDTTLLSTGEGPVLLGANCPSTYWGPRTGSWSLGCLQQVPHAADQSVESALQTAAAMRFMEHHVARLPVVALARVGRVWDLYEPLQMVDVDVNEGRPAPASLAGLVAYYALVPFAVAGVVGFRRRKLPVWPLMTVAGIVTVVAAAGYGQVRFRAEFEVPLVLLAAVGATDAVGWLRTRTRRSPVAAGGVAAD